MAVFFNHPVRVPPKSGGSPHLLEWHSSQALLAVASKNEAADADGVVHFYLEKVSEAVCLQLRYAPGISSVRPGGIVSY